MRVITINITGDSVFTRIPKLKADAFKKDFRSIVEKALPFQARNGCSIMVGRIKDSVITNGGDISVEVFDEEDELATPMLVYTNYRTEEKIYFLANRLNWITFEYMMNCVKDYIEEHNEGYVC